MKFYVETFELTAHGDSAACVFHHDQPFDTIDEAKAWAKANPGEDYIAIYQCENDVIHPILEAWNDKCEWKAWQP